MITLRADTPLTLDQFIAVARYGEKIRLSKSAMRNVAEVAKKAQAIVAKGDRVVYGLNTGVGAFSEVQLPAKKLEAFSRNIVLSHAAGVGDPFKEEVTRGAMLAQLRAFLTARSGIRPEMCLVLEQALNSGVTPEVPQQGSLGASGDLAPLAHLWLVLSRDKKGEQPGASGKAKFRGKIYTGAEAMRRAKIRRVSLIAGEGLSAVNGTYFMTSMLCMVIEDAQRLAKVADVAAAMTMEASCAVSGALDKRIHELRPHPGQIASSGNLRSLLGGSTIIDSRPDIVQDAYALRCSAQVHGASRGLLRYARDVCDIELNSVSDNPLLCGTEPDLEFISGGNFHGEPVGYAADSVCLLLTGFANISERRSFRLLDEVMNRGLPNFLVKSGGIHCGLMITSYTAASLVSENKGLCYPATVDSIPSSRNQEDHVSMATIATRKARQVMENTWHVLAIEALISCQAIDFRLQSEKELKRKPKLGQGTRKAHDLIRQKIPFLKADRIQSKDIAKAYDLMHNASFLRRIERAIGHPLE